MRRGMNMPAGDLGELAHRKIDFEVRIKRACRGGQPAPLDLEDRRGCERVLQGSGHAGEESVGTRIQGDRLQVQGTCQGRVNLGVLLESFSGR